jgi:hypothetical protein
MAEATTPADAFRIGLAHGAVQTFSEHGNPALIPPDRAASAGLAFLALGDWNGQGRTSAPVEERQNSRNYARSAKVSQIPQFRFLLL